MFCRGKNIFFWYQQFFSWSYLRYQLFMFNLEYAQIIKILEPNSSTYCFITSINWSLYSLLIKLLAVVTLWHLLLKIMMNLVEEVPRFCLVIFLILSTLHVSLINPNSFIVTELSRKMNLISAEIPSIYHAASSVCNASNSFWCNFKKMSFVTLTLSTFPQELWLIKV